LPAVVVGDDQRDDPTLVEEMDGAPVDEAGSHEFGGPRQRLLVVQGVAQDGRDLGQQGGRCPGPFLFFVVLRPTQGGRTLHGQVLEEGLVGWREVPVFGEPEDEAPDRPVVDQGDHGEGAVVDDR
jgi:hypothetical protein